MPKTKTVVVDAEALEKALEYLEDYGCMMMHSAYDTWLESFAPIVPTLPEGAVCFQRDTHAIAVSWREPCGDYRVARIDADGLSTTTVGGFTCDRPMPHRINFFLTHAWSNR